MMCVTASMVNICSVHRPSSGRVPLVRAGYGSRMHSSAAQSFPRMAAAQTCVRLNYVKLLSHFTVFSSYLYGTSRICAVKNSVLTSLVQTIKRRMFHNIRCIWEQANRRPEMTLLGNLDMTLAIKTALGSFTTQSLLLLVVKCAFRSTQRTCLTNVQCLR
jgi:hypothetical protein